MARKRIRYAQNFLKNTDLVRALLKKSSITKNDTVVEIGPGRGIITRELAQMAGRVVAVEIDEVLVKRLRNQFSASASNVTIIHDDFEALDLPGPRYKLFSDIPFNRTADIMRMIYRSGRFLEAYLILQKEAAGKYAGIFKETEASVLAKPFYRFQLLHQFRPHDFEPAPAVDSVMLHIIQRDHPLVSQEVLYRRFVRHGFRSAKSNLRLAYKEIFTYRQWIKLSRQLGFSRNVKPTDLSFPQWLELFDYFQKGVIKEKQRRLSW